MRRKRTLPQLVMLVAAMLPAVTTRALTSIVALPEPARITVKAQGLREDRRFALVFERRAGSIGGLYDLDRDPDMIVNLAAIGEGNGFALFQNRAEFVLDGEQVAVQPGPASRFEIIESSDVRVIIETEGDLVDRTGSPPGMLMAQRLERVIGEDTRKTEIPRYRTRFTVYPTGRVFIRHAWTLKGNSLTLASNRVILGTAPTDQIVAMTEHGSGAEPMKDAACFILHHGAGGDFVNDVLLVSDRRRYVVDWLGQTMSLRGRCGWTRSGFCLQNKPQVLKPGTYGWDFMLQVEPPALNGPEDAAPYVSDYISPAVLTFPERHGRRRLEEPDDLNLDGFVESRGCYVMTASPRGGVTFTLDAGEHTRYHPAFEVHGWKGGAPVALTLDGETIGAGNDYTVHLDEKVLSFQYLGVLRPGKHVFQAAPPVEKGESSR